MTGKSRRALFWVPRVASILFIAFISLFALDVFGEGQGGWNILVALLIHLIPCFVLIVVLVLAWRREWIGTVLYGAAGALYVWMVVSRVRVPAGVKVLWCLTIAGPAFVIAALFWLNWIKRNELRGGAERS